MALPRSLYVKFRCNTPWTPTDDKQEFLIGAGHEDDMISVNSDWETPLMVAAMAGKEDVGIVLAKCFPECIPLQNKAGLDAVWFPRSFPEGGRRLISYIAHAWLPGWC